jgi:hypothetical protein
MKKTVSGARASNDGKQNKLALNRETVRMLTRQQLALIAAGVCFTSSNDTEITTGASC